MEMNKDDRGPMLLVNIVGGFFVCALLFLSFTHSRGSGNFVWSYLLIGAYFAFNYWWRGKYFEKLSPEMKEVYRSASQRGRVSGRWIGIILVVASLIGFWFFIR